jgi:hypothetical protein
MWASKPSLAASRTPVDLAPAVASIVGPDLVRTGGPRSGAWKLATDSAASCTAVTSAGLFPNMTIARIGTPPMRSSSWATAASPAAARNSRPVVAVRARISAAATTATATPGKWTSRTGALSRFTGLADRLGSDLAVEDLVGDCGEGGADGAGGNTVEGGAGGVDLGLGGAAGLGEGG